MIPVNTTREVEANIPNSVHNAQIEVNGMAFKVLSSNLYTDRILAIVRELSCNAWDAHAMVGKTNTPFEVSLPSELNSELRIRDFGPGLSKADLPRVYTTFFGSTKRDSNDQIGGFGLGSKSPLSYTDAFTVSSYQDGVVCTYAIFLQKDGSPGVTMVNETTTDQPNGLEVIVPVEPRHVGEFCDRASRALCYFPTPPRVRGATIEMPAYAVKNDEFGIRTDARSGADIIMGHVAYRLSINALDSATRSEFSDLLYGVNLDIFRPIGSLEIQPSREALSYDETTKRELHQVLERIQEQLFETVQAGITKCKTFPDALDTFKQSRDGISFRLFRGHTFTWRNRAIKKYEVHVTAPPQNIARIVAHTWTRTNLSLQFKKRIEVADPRHVVVVWHDLGGGPYIRRLQHNKTLIGDNALVVRGDKTLLRAVLKQLGIRRFITLSQLPVPAEGSTPTAIRDLAFAQINRSGKLHKASGSRAITAATALHLDADGALAWVGLSGSEVLPQDGIAGRHLCRAISLVDDLYTMDLCVVGIPRGAKQFEKTLNSHVLPYLHAQLDRYETEHDVATQRSVATTALFDVPNFGEWRQFTAEYRAKHPQSLVAKFVRATANARATNRGPEIHTYLAACNCLGRTPIPASTSAVIDLAGMYTTLQQAYPLLPLIVQRGWVSDAENNSPHITQYLEAIDNERNALLHPERTVTHNFLRGRPQKRQSRAQQVGTDPRGTPRRAVRRDPRSHRPANRPTAIC